MIKGPAFFANLDLRKQPHFQVGQLQVEKVQEPRQDAIFAQIKVRQRDFANVFAERDAAAMTDGQRRVETRFLECQIAHALHGDGGFPHSARAQPISRLCRDLPQSDGHLIDRLPHAMQSSYGSMLARLEFEFESEKRLAVNVEQSGRRVAGHILAERFEFLLSDLARGDPDRRNLQHRLPAERSQRLNLKFRQPHPIAEQTTSAERALAIAVVVDEDQEIGAILFARRGDQHVADQERAGVSSRSLQSERTVRFRWLR